MTATAMGLLLLVPQTPGGPPEPRTVITIVVPGEFEIGDIVVNVEPE